MRIDLPTLYAVSALATAVSGLMLLFSWLQNRTATTLAWWGGATLVLVAAGVLLALRGVVSDPLSIIVGNFLWLGAYGMMWSGARVFEGRAHRPVLAAAGALAWLVLCQNETFYATPELRIRVFSAINLAYALLIPWEYWRARTPRPMSRWPAIVLLLIQAVLYAARVPLAERLVFPIAPDNVGLLIPLGIVGLLLHFFCMAFLVMAMVKERLELQFRHAALVDPLTGIANRRAFFERGERILARIGASGGSAALLMIDLDLFKRINDTLGHEAGDRALCVFCATAADLLRPTDLLARTGGEEFACLLPGATTAHAVRVANRIRLRFAAQRPVIGTPDTLTVSIGVATTASSGYGLTALMATADRALYAAKASGRDRVTWLQDDDPGADRPADSIPVVTGTASTVDAFKPEDSRAAAFWTGSGRRDLVDVVESGRCNHDQHVPLAPSPDPSIRPGPSSP